MRFSPLALALSVLSVLTACSQNDRAVETGSIGEDLLESGFQSFSAAIKVPKTVLIDPTQTDFVVTLAVDGGEPQSQRWPLTENRDPAVSTLLAEEASSDTIIYVFDVPPEAQARLEAIREQIEVFREQGVTGSLSLAVTPRRLCRQPTLKPGPTPIDMFLKTADTNDFVAIAQDVDLRSIVGEEIDLLTLIPQCPPGATG